MDSYLIESEDFQSFQNEKDKIIKDMGFKDASISSYDLEEVSLENALEDLDTYGFLSDKKVIVLTNIENLKYDENKTDLDHLFKYISNPNPDNLLIIYSKGNNTLKTIKELKKICKNIEVKKNTMNQEVFYENFIKKYIFNKEHPFNDFDDIEEYNVGKILPVIKKQIKIILLIQVSFQPFPKL